MVYPLEPLKFNGKSMTRHLILMLIFRDLNLHVIEHFAFLSLKKMRVLILTISYSNILVNYSVLGYYDQSH